MGKFDIKFYLNYSSHPLGDNCELIKMNGPIWFRIFHIVYRGHDTLKLVLGIFYYVN